MRHIFLTIVTMFALVLSVSADNLNEGKFDPERYNRELETFVVNEAKLTPQEAQAFLPLFREMLQKQRELFKKQRELQHKQPTDEQSALEAIKGMDCVDIQMKKLQQNYHNRYLKVLPAVKVFYCIKAVEHFNRDMMKKMAQPPKKRPF